ncbi:MAG: transposase family protein [Planctomycetota bacterium]
MIASASVIFTTFQNLPDPRVDAGNKKHSLYEMVVITLCATICGAESWTDVERFGSEKYDWFKTFLELENDIPSHDTIGRVFCRAGYRRLQRVGGR